MAMNYDREYTQEDARAMKTFSGNALIDTPREPTAFDNASDTFTAAYHLCERVHSIVNRIVGHAAEVQGTMAEKVTPVSNGIIEELRDKAFRTERSIRAAQNALDRLEAQI